MASTDEEQRAVPSGGDMETSGDVEEIAVDDIVKEKGSTIEFSLEVLPLVKTAQNQHGLRHGDHQRYRIYCTRRLRRIRKSLHFTFGHRNRYHKRPLTPNHVTDVKYLYIPLMCAERAWSLAMELKQDSYTETRKRFHLHRRLRKAAKYANELVTLCEECKKCDARTLLEAQAYADWIVGNVEFEQQNWQMALDAFVKSQTVYQKLSDVVAEGQRVMYQQRVEEITPNIRYCAYNIEDMPTDVAELMKLRADASVSLAAKIDEVLVQTGEKAVLALDEVQWQGKTVPIKNERVKLSLVKVNQMVSEVRREEDASSKAAKYEKILMECQEAIQFVREDINTDNLSDKKRTHKMEQHRANLGLLLDYLTHTKLVQSIQRNLLLLQTLSGGGKYGQKQTKPEEFVRVYDILLQHVTELNDLPANVGDPSEQKYRTAQTFMFKAFRCYYLSESYTSMKKWPEAVGLLGRAGDHCIQALELYRESGNQTEAEGDKVKLAQLQSSIRGKKCEIQVNSIMEDQGLEEQMADLNIQDKPLTERLDKFAPSTSVRNITLAPLPPDYKPLPGKPLFFDLALDHIEFPSLGHRAEKKGGAGLAGFVKGLFWGRN